MHEDKTLEFAGFPIVESPTTPLGMVLVETGQTIQCMDDPPHTERKIIVPVPAPKEPLPDMSGLWHQPQTTPRITWDSYFMEVAYVIAKRGTCLRKHVGAVITLNNNILSTGYNGAPKGSKHCTEVGCKLSTIDGDDDCVRTVHAEVNAVLHSISERSGATLYCTDIPCRNCALLIANSGITKVVFDRHRSNSSKEADTKLIFEESDIELLKHLK